MKTAVKLLALALALLMLVPCFAACSGGDSGNNDGGNGDQTTTVGGNGSGDGGENNGDETVDSQYIVDMGGYDFKAYAWMDAHADDNDDPINPIFYIIDFYYESISESRDPITIATWTRNQEIEANYNCFITPTKATTNHSVELTNLWSGNKKYDLAIILDRHAAECATKNLLTDLKSKKNIKLNEAYYDQNSIDQLSMGGKLYYLSGEMNASTLDNACVTIVNDKMYQNALVAKGEKPVYDKVKDGEWTMAEMMRLASLVNLDVGEDGIYKIDGGDIWGYLPYATSAIYHFYACGGRITFIDDDGYPSMAIDSDASIKAINTLMETINKANLPTGVTHVWSIDRDPRFAAEKVLFTDTIIWYVRDATYPSVTTWKYGILPMALVDNSQYNPADTKALGYLSTVQYGYNGSCALWCMPSFYNNVEYATILFDAFADFSARPGSTMEAFYTKTISLQAAKDENSRQMVDIIKHSLTYDIAGCYDADWGGFQSLIQSIVSTTSNPVNSITPAKVAQATLNMEFTLEAFKFPSDPDVQ